MRSSVAWYADMLAREERVPVALAAGCSLDVCPASPHRRSSPYWRSSMRRWGCSEGHAEPRRPAPPIAKIRPNVGESGERIAAVSGRWGRCAEKLSRDGRALRPRPLAAGSHIWPRQAGDGAVRLFLSRLHHLQGEPPFAKIAFEIGGRKRHRVEETLRLLAVLVQEKARLRFRLDAFGDDAEPEVVRHRDERAHDGGILGVIGDAAR